MQPGRKRASSGPEEAQREEDRHVEDALVEERRVEALDGLVAERPVGGVDGEAPRQVRRAADQLLVEPVADPADGLRERHADDRAVEERADRPAARLRVDDDREQAADERPEDPEAALRHVEGLHRLAAVELVVGDHVVEPRADERDGRREQARPGRLDRVAATPPPQERRRRHPDGVPEEREQAVPLHVERSEAERLAGRRGHGRSLRPRRPPAGFR